MKNKGEKERYKHLHAELQRIARRDKKAFFSVTGWDIDLDYCDIEWLALEMNRDHSVIFETYQPGEFIFQCHIVLPCHTVHEVLKARILKWFAIPFSRGPHFVRTLHHGPSVLGGPTWHGS